MGAAMKAVLFRRVLCAALIAGGATLAYAGNERPRDTGVACSRAGNTYCNLQDPAAGRLPHGATTEARVTD